MALLTGHTPLRNLAVKAASVPLEKGCRLVLTIVAARLLGDAAFGRYSYAASLTTLLALLTDLGLGLWTTRELARDRASGMTRAEVIVGTGLRLRLAAALPFALIVCTLGALERRGDVKLALLASGVAALAVAFIEHCNAVFRGYERLADEAKCNAVTAALAMAGGLGLLLSMHGEQRGIVALAVGVAVGNIGGCIFALWRLARGYGLSPARPQSYDAALARHIPREAVPLGLAMVLSVIYFKADVVLVTALAGDVETGRYAAAYKLFEGTMIAPAVVLAVIFAPIARADPDLRRRLEWLTALTLVGVGVVASGVLYFGAELIVHHVYGDDFAPAAAPLRVLALTIPLLFLNYGLTHFLVARDLQRWNLVLSAVLVVVNVGGNLAAIPRLGGVGAAWVTLVTEVVLTAGCLAVLSRRVEPAHR